MDEFQDHVAEKSLSEEKPGSKNIDVGHLLKLLDGRLDAKYEKVFLKEKNVAITLISKELPYLFKKTGPWAERIIPLQFLSHLHEIVEERLIRTAPWGSRIEIRGSSMPRGGVNKNFLQMNEIYLKPQDRISSKSAANLRIYGLCQILVGNRPGLEILLRKTT